jgi:hypothetical protein
MYVRYMSTFVIRAAVPSRKRNGNVKLFIFTDSIKTNKTKKNWAKYMGIIKVFAS